MWISENISNLASIYSIIIKPSNRKAALEREYPSISTSRHAYRYYQNVEDCTTTSAAKCALSDILKTRKAYCDDFTFEKTKAGLGETIKTVNLIAKKTHKHGQKYTCEKCFYNNMVDEFIKRIIHCILEARIYISGRGNVDVQFIGLIQNNSPNTKLSTTTKYESMILCLKCDKIIIAPVYYGNDLCYLELVPNKRDSNSFTVSSTSLLDKCSGTLQVFPINIRNIKYIKGNVGVSNLHNGSAAKNIFEIYLKYTLLNKQDYPDIKYGKIKKPESKKVVPNVSKEKLIDSKSVLKLIKDNIIVIVLIAWLGYVVVTELTPKKITPKIIKKDSIL